MDKTPTSEEPQAGDTETNPQPQAGTTTPTEPQAGDSQSDTTISLDEAKKLRSESANLRQRLKAAEASAKELNELKAKLEEEKLSELEKRDKRLADLQRRESDRELQTQERLINAEIKYQMALLGIKNPKLARLIERERLEFDEQTGEPTNVDVLLKELLQEIPELDRQQQQQQQRQAPTSGGATNPSRTQSSAVPTITWDYIGSLKPADYQALSSDAKRAITQFMANNPAPPPVRHT